MGNGLPGQPFDAFALVDNAPATPVVFGRYKTYTAPAGTGLVLRDQELVNNVDPEEPLPKAILLTTAPDNSVSDSGLSLPGILSVQFDLGPFGWPVHTTIIQSALGLELKAIEIRFGAISASTGLYMLQIDLWHWTGQGVNAKVRTVKWI